MALDRRDLRRGPSDSGPPFQRVLEVPPIEVVGGQLLPRRPRIGERALRQDALVDAGIGVRDLLLDERAAGAPGPDRVAKGPVALDQVLLRITSDSASVARSQLWPALSSAVDITAKPIPSAVVGLEPPTVSPVTLGASPLWWSMPQLAPWVIRSLWLNCGCGLQGAHGFPGWSRTAILYWSRS